VTEPHKKARADLGHTEMVGLKLHPDLMAHVKARAAENYQSASEYLRGLIVADMRGNAS